MAEGADKAALFLDIAGTPHVSYVWLDSTVSELRYAVRSSGGWRS